MALTITSKHIRPEDGWMEFANAPIVSGIYPSLKHPWYLAVSDTKPDEAYENELTLGIGKDKLKPFLSEEYSGLLATGQKIWVRIKEPPNADPYTKLKFTVVEAA